MYIINTPNGKSIKHEGSYPACFIDELVKKYDYVIIYNNSNDTINIAKYHKEEYAGDYEGHDCVEVYVEKLYNFLSNN